MARYEPAQNWAQTVLFDGGYDRITAEFIVHLTGRTGEVECGLTVRDLYTDECLAITAFVWSGKLDEVPGLADWISDSLKEAARHLNPF